MKNLVFILFLINACTLYSQAEANHWFFGQNAGVNFNNGNIVSLFSSLNTIEGCSSYSDSSGNLLFYSDGIQVWNRNHILMPNGTDLKGNPSSTQSAIIVPNPSNSTKYFIFTVGNNINGIGGSGLNCYVIDMTLDGGLGDVSGGPINLSDGRDEQWTEKVTSVKTADCDSYWVISLVADTYYAYKVDANGLDTTNPVRSKVDYFSKDVRGYLKLSPDGKKLASATYNTSGTGLGEGKLHLYSFNASTGIVSNDAEVLISNTALNGEPYGVEFSPNSSKLYVSTFDISLNYKLYQFDLLKTNITNSQIEIHSQIGFRGALQLAPNGKIYATIPENYETGTKYLDVINNPDLEGLACDFKTDAIDLINGRAMQGLPPFIASFLTDVGIANQETGENIANQTVTLCNGESYTFSAINVATTGTFSWEHNNVEIGNSSNLTLTNIQPNDTGTYKLIANVIDNCGIPIPYEAEFQVDISFMSSSIPTISYTQCDFDEDSTDGITQFNLNTIIDEITNNDPNLKVLFYESQNDFDNNIPIDPIDDFKNSTQSPFNQTILTKVTNIISGCYISSMVELIISPSDLNNYSDMYACENDASVNIQDSISSIGSGEGSFDFGIQRQKILDLLATPDIEIEFYQSRSDAQSQVDKIVGIQDFSDREIFVRIYNIITNDCISVGKFNLFVNSIPVIQGLEEEIILCINNPRDNPQLMTVNLVEFPSISGDTFQWYYNGAEINGATNATYEANAGGSYKIEVSRTFENDFTDLTDDTICNGFTIFTVVESNPPIIRNEDLSITDDSTNNTISVSTGNLGSGDYEFSLNNEFFSYQDEPYFEDVEAGIHTLFIRDKNGCGLSSIELAIIGYPKFFTPNNDGQNDKWKVLGVNENFYVNSNIFIYNRYGKLITQIDPRGEGWDGTFNGEVLPSTDYWFSVELKDDIGNVIIKKGHFSLFRQ
jgi:gliding motility-associated-like protein